MSRGPVESAMLSGSPRPERPLAGRVRFHAEAPTLLELMAAIETRAEELMAGVPYEVDRVDVDEPERIEDPDPDPVALAKACRGERFSATVVLRYDVVREGGWNA